MRLSKTVSCDFLSKDLKNKSIMPLTIARKKEERSSIYNIFE